MRSMIVTGIRGVSLLILVSIAVALIYLIYSANQDNESAQSACEEQYPNYTEVVGLTGLDIGTVCFDESGETVKFLGMLEE